MALKIRLTRGGAKKRPFYTSSSQKARCPATVASWSGSASTTRWFPTRRHREQSAPPGRRRQGQGLDGRERQADPACPEDARQARHLRSAGDPGKKRKKSALKAKAQERLDEQKAKEEEARAAAEEAAAAPAEEAPTEEAAPAPKKPPRKLLLKRPPLKRPVKRGQILKRRRGTPRLQIRSSSARLPPRMGSRTGADKPFTETPDGIAAYGPVWVRLRGDLTDSALGLPDWREITFSGVNKASLFVP